MSEAIPKLKAGQTIGPEALHVTMERMRTYENWPVEKNVHSDEDIAQQKGFKQPICRAMMFSVVVDKLLYESFGPSYLRGGKLKLKYVKAMLPGETCFAHGEVREKREAETATQYVVDVRIANDSKENIAIGVAEIDVSH